MPDRFVAPIFLNEFSERSVVLETGLEQAVDGVFVVAVPGRSAISMSAPCVIFPTKVHSIVYERSRARRKMRRKEVSAQPLLAALSASRRVQAEQAVRPPTNGDA